MDKRLFLALLLTAIVIIAPPLFFKRGGVQRATSGVDTSRALNRADTNKQALAPAAEAPAQTAGAAEVPSQNAAPVQAPVETTTVETRLARYRFTSQGAVPISVALDSYPSRRPGAAANAASQLLPAKTALAHLRLALGADTISLDTVSLRGQTTPGTTGPTVTYAGAVAGRPLTLTYSVVADSFLLRVAASVAGAPAGSALLLTLPKTLQSNEPDTLDDMHHLAVSYRLKSGGDIESVAFSKLDSGEVRTEARQAEWVATRNKYFLVAYRAAPKTPFTGVLLQGLPRSGKVANAISASVVLPLTPDGRAAFDIYTGPQDFERLQKLGGDLDQVNPYGGILRAVVQPFAVIVMKVLLWIKRTTHLNYGWVLVLFGVIIRLALWPLNQGAMRTSLKMQRLQPELQALQKKYSDDPRKQQEAIMKVYKDHGMSPLSPLMGCLPMLLPMPVLFALYFVFQNTIEFRGVPFLWLPDISLRDPFFITPILMGLSMFLMSWIGMRNAPPNPQAKMMMFMMPVMLTVLFFNFASGLNLYYAVQNVAAIPQQWLLARERAKEPPPATAVVRGMPAPAQKRRS